MWQILQHKKRLANSRYITGINGLRTLAVGGVILYHLIPFQVPGGFLGVVIFLVLTGYLLTDLLVQEWQQNGKVNLLGFYRRRIKRLYPALVTMLFATAAYMTLFQRQLLAQLRGILWSNLLYVYNWWQIFHGQSYFDRFANNESPFTHLWTLSIEGQLYLIWPVLIVSLILLFKRRRRIAQALFGLGLLSVLLMAWLYVPGHDPSRVYYGTDTRLFTVLFGAALAFIWPSTKLRQKIDRPQRWLLNSIGVLAFVAILGLYLVTDPQGRFVYRGGMGLFTGLVVLLTATVVHPGAQVNCWLTNPIFNWVGKRSYGIYLYQFPVMIFYENQVKNIAQWPWLHFVVQLVLILVISELSYRLVERPFAHFNWHQWQSWLRKLVQPHSGYGWQRLMVLPFLLVFALGLTGAVIAPAHAVAQRAPLAKQIKRNSKQNSRRKASLIAQAQKQSAKAHSATTSQATSKQTDQPVAGLSLTQTQQAKQLPVVAIGDSVMLDSLNVLQQAFPKMIIDAKVGRQVKASSDLLNYYAAKGVLPDVVLIGLGTNGAFTPQQLAEIMRQVGPKRQVFWINVRVPTRSWQNSVNATLRRGAQQWPNLTVIDWYNYSQGHSAWFYKDQVHPNNIGKQHYSDFIAQQLLKQVKH
uniref:Acyltransferase n=1 Tax=Loigolactobacillus rennini TaxID=238013 RepID=A0A1K2I6I0_9LACO|nr:Acyltransferase [Loigolactobacillus rennini]